MTILIALVSLDQAQYDAEDLVSKDPLSLNIQRSTASSLVPPPLHYSSSLAQMTYCAHFLLDLACTELADTLHPLQRRIEKSSDSLLCAIEVCKDLPSHAEALLDSLPTMHLNATTTTAPKCEDGDVTVPYPHAPHVIKLPIAEDQSFLSLTPESLNLSSVERVTPVFLDSTDHLGGNIQWPNESATTGQKRTSTPVTAVSSVPTTNQSNHSDNISGTHRTPHRNELDTSTTSFDGYDVVMEPTSTENQLNCKRSRLLTSHLDDNSHGINLSIKHSPAMEKQTRDGSTEAAPRPKFDPSIRVQEGRQHNRSNSGINFRNSETHRSALISLAFDVSCFLNHIPLVNLAPATGIDGNASDGCVGQLPTWYVDVYRSLQSSSITNTSTEHTLVALSDQENCGNVEAEFILSPYFLPFFTSITSQEDVNALHPILSQQKTHSHNQLVAGSTPASLETIGDLEFRRQMSASEDVITRLDSNIYVVLQHIQDAMSERSSRGNVSDSLSFNNTTCKTTDTVASVERLSSEHPSLLELYLALQTFWQRIHTFSLCAHLATNYDQTPLGLKSDPLQSHRADGLLHSPQSPYSWLISPLSVELASRSDWSMRLCRCFCSVAPAFEGVMPTLLTQAHASVDASLTQDSWLPELVHDYLSATSMFMAIIQRGALVFAHNDDKSTQETQTHEPRNSFPSEPIHGKAESDVYLTCLLLFISSIKPTLSARGAHTTVNRRDISSNAGSRQTFQESWRLLFDSTQPLPSQIFGSQPSLHRGNHSSPDLDHVLEAMAMILEPYAYQNPLCSVFQSKVQARSIDYHSTLASLHKTIMTCSSTTQNTGKKEGDVDVYSRLFHNLLLLHEDTLAVFTHAWSPFLLTSLLNDMQVNMDRILPKLRAWREVFEWTQQKHVYNMNTRLIGQLCSRAQRVEREITHQTTLLKDQLTLAGEKLSQSASSLQEQYRKDVSEYQHAITALHMRCEEAEQALSRALHELLSLNSDIRQTTQKNIDQNRVIERMRVENLELAGKMTEMELREGELMERIHKLTESCEELRAEVKSKDDIVNEGIAKNVQLTETVAALTTENEVQQQLIRDLQKKVDEISSLYLQEQEKSRSLAADRDMWRSTCQEGEHRYTKALDAMTELGEQVRSLQNDLALVSHEREQAVMDTTQVKNALKAEINALQNQKRQLTERVDTISLDFDVLERQKRDLESANEELRTQLKEEQTKVDQFRAILDVKEAKLSEEMSAKTKLQEDVQTGVIRYQELVEASKASIAKLKQTHSDELNAQSRKYDDAITAMRTENEEMQKAHSASLAQIKRKLAEMTRQKDDLLSKYVNTEQKNNELQSLITKLEAEKAVSATAMKRINTENRKLEKKHQELEAVHTQAQNRVSELSSQLREKDFKIAELRKKLQASDGVMSELQQKLGKYKSIVSTLQSLSDDTQ